GRGHGGREAQALVAGAEEGAETRPAQPGRGREGDEAHAGPIMPQYAPPKGASMSRSQVVRALLVGGPMYDGLYDLFPAFERETGLRVLRSEERRVGKEWRSRWAADH